MNTPLSAVDFNATMLSHASDLDDASRMTAPEARQTGLSAGVVSVRSMMATSVSAPARFSILRSHHPVGASTGYMYDLRGDWPAQGQSGLGAVAVRDRVVGARRGGARRPCRLLGEPARTPLSIPQRSRPVQGTSPARTGSRRQAERPLGARRRNRDASRHDRRPALYRPLGRKLVLENMDARKEDGRSVDELAGWFAELPEAGFCFDIAHAWSIDETMAAGSELLDAFRSRLRHLHVSSLSRQLHHEPLTEEHEELFMPLLQRCLDVPWILEAPPRES